MSETWDGDWPMSASMVLSVAVEHRLVCPGFSLHLQPQLNRPIHKRLLISRDGRLRCRRRPRYVGVGTRQSDVRPERATITESQYTGWQFGFDI